MQASKAAAHISALFKSDACAVDSVLSVDEECVAAKSGVSYAYMNAGSILVDCQSIMPVIFDASVLSTNIFLI